MICVNDVIRVIKLNISQALPQSDDLEKESDVILLIKSLKQFNLGGILGICIT